MLLQAAAAATAAARTGGTEEDEREGTGRVGSTIYVCVGTEKISVGRDVLYVFMAIVDTSIPYGKNSVGLHSCMATVDTFGFTLHVHN